MSQSLLFFNWIFCEDMKVRILNVKYSKNVGDGIIAECIEHFFLQYNTVDIKSVDLSGKKNFSVNKNAKLGKGFIAYKFIDIFPNRVSKFLIERLVPFIMKYKLGSYFKEELSDADVLIIGGGQLFQDKKMYFPPRILSALNNLNRNAVIYVYAVGVAQDWTSVGKDCKMSFF